MINIQGHYHHQLSFCDIDITETIDVEIKHQISDEYLSVSVNKQEAEQIINHLKEQFGL